MASLSRAILVLGAVSVIGSATQVAKGKLGAQLLGAAGVGILNQLTSLYGLLFIVAGLGFFNGTMHQITKAVRDGDGRQARAHMNSVTLFIGGVSLLVSLGCVAGAGWISDMLFGDGGQRAALVAVIVLAVPIAVQQRVFRAYLNAMHDIRSISRAQTGADVTSVLIFALGAWLFGIRGAVAAFVGMHVLLFCGMMAYAVKSGGIGLALPSFRSFRWPEIAANFGFGINGLITTAVSSLAMIALGRMVISVAGLAEAGIFSVALKVATVYLGALYASAGGYYFPTLVRSETRDELQLEVNRAVALYMTLLPPVMVVLIGFGDIIIPLLFSDEFRPAVPVMAGLLFGDIFRVGFETTGLALTANRRLVASTLIYIVYSAGFVGLSWWMLPWLGLKGIALAYIVMSALNFALILAMCRLSLAIRLSSEGVAAMSLAVLAVAPEALAELAGLGFVPRLGIGAASLTVWLALSWQLPEMARLRAQTGARLGRFTRLRA